MKRFLFFFGALTMGVSAAAAATFNFDDVAPGTATPFSVTADGITAQFASPTGSSFEVISSIYSTLTGQVLKSDDPIQDVLEISFSSPMASATVRFALNPTLPGAPPDFVPPMSLEAYLGSALTGSTTVVGTPQGGPFSDVEGVISLGGSFDRLRLATGAFDFAVDDIVVAPVPEPSSVQLYLAGMLVILAFAARKQRLTWRREG
jgi:hypothetical protein